jgi:hypothetical protein
VVTGLQLFAERFAGFQNQYVLIGGAACYTAMKAVGVDFRATKDLDIVLCLEEMTDDFISTFWEFVRDGGYQTQQTEQQKKQYYRFSRPSNSDFPAMLELFSRVPDQLSLSGRGHLTPIPADDDISSLSAILLDRDYYALIQSGRRVVSGTSIVSAEYLIPLKARAWLDLSDRKTNGDQVDGKNIKKHRSDVFRLFTVLDPRFSASLPRVVTQDVERFVDRISRESIDLKALGITQMSLQDVLTELRRIYARQ